MQERRSEDVLVKRIIGLESGHKELKESLERNTLITKQIQENTDELLEFFNTAKGGLKTASWLGKAFKFFTGLFVAGFAFYVAVKQFLGNQ